MPFRPFWQQSDTSYRCGGPHSWRRHGYGPPGLAHKRRFLFWRFAALFGGVFLLFLIGIIVVLILAFGDGRVEHFPFGLLFLAACGVPLAFFVLSAFLGGWAFRRIGTPLAEFMSASEAVAQGDLQVRMNEGMPGEFGRLARSFNHMTAELERAEQQRRGLTADVAHELRTPLHIIQGNLEGMLDGVYEPSEQNLTRTLEETRLLSRLVSDLQTISLAEAGQLTLHRSQFAAADLFSDVVTSFSGQASELGVNLVLNLSEGAGQIQLDADPDRMDQVLSNLVANALRYTPAGGQVTLGLQIAAQDVILTVEDNGAGIPPEDLPHIFNRFWRGDRARSRSQGGGSGLGLAIARQLVQAHGGSIQVESQPGQGTLFTIQIPVKSR